ncbi:hypothetical protein ACJX0J_034645, partial [Zea mays]
MARKLSSFLENAGYFLQLNLATQLEAILHTYKLTQARQIACVPDLLKVALNCIDNVLSILYVFAQSCFLWYAGYNCGSSLSYPISFYIYQLLSSTAILSEKQISEEEPYKICNFCCALNKNFMMEKENKREGIFPFLDIINFQKMKSITLQYYMINADTAN